MLIVFYCLPGTPGPNRFDPAPGSATEDLEATFTSSGEGRRDVDSGLGAR